jgi:GNAT superfamily N-acetyltransferase
MDKLFDSQGCAPPGIPQEAHSAMDFEFAKRWHERDIADGPGSASVGFRTDHAGCGLAVAPHDSAVANLPNRNGFRQALTFAWATSQERKRVIALAIQEGRQTMNLRTREGAELVVLRRSDGQLVGWAGVDVNTDPDRPELFSEFVYPEYRGIGLGALLEHFWWAYLDSHGYSRGYMRMELDSNQALVERRLRSGYCRQATYAELGQQFVTACRNCELFGTACHRQIFLAVDVQQALATKRRSRGPLDIDSLPLPIVVGLKDRNRRGAGNEAA